MQTETGTLKTYEPDVTKKSHSSETWGSGYRLLLMGSCLIKMKNKL